MLGHNAYGNCKYTSSFSGILFNLIVLIAIASTPKTESYLLQCIAQIAENGDM